MGNLCIFSRRRRRNSYMNRLVYMMFLQIAEAGRDFVITLPIELEKKHVSEYMELRKAVKTMDSDYVIRHTSVRVVYIALKEYLENMSSPLLVNRNTVPVWWVSLAEVLVFVLVVKEVEHSTHMQRFYAEKIKRKLKLLKGNKYILTKLMISMLRAITWSRSKRRFRQDQLMNFISDLRKTFLDLPKPKELDVVMVIVCFMVHYATVIFGQDVDLCLLGLKRPSVLSGTHYRSPKTECTIKSIGKRLEKRDSATEFKISRRHSDSVVVLHKLPPDGVEIQDKNESRITI